MAKDTFYFEHDANARTDDKILELRARHGWMGYGLFWAVVEMLREAEGYRLSLGSTAGLAMALSITKDDFEKLLATCLELGLFETEDERWFYSQSLRRRMSAWDSKRDRLIAAGRKGGKSRWLQKQGDTNTTGDAQAEPMATSKHGHSNPTGDAQAIRIEKNKIPPQPPQGMGSRNIHHVATTPTAYSQSMLDAGLERVRMALPSRITVDPDFGAVWQQYCQMMRAHFPYTTVIQFDAIMLALQRTPNPIESLLYSVQNQRRDVLPIRSGKATTDGQQQQRQQITRVVVPENEAESRERLYEQQWKQQHGTGSGTPPMETKPQTSSAPTSESTTETSSD